jgi:hypothetical protein
MAKKKKKVAKQAEAKVYKTMVANLATAKRFQAMKRQARTDALKEIGEQLGEATFTMHCIVCGAKMEARRVTRMTCSVRCRVAHHRQIQKQGEN